MRPNFHPVLVNGSAGDPALFVDCLFEYRALLFDLGENLPNNTLFVVYWHHDGYLKRFEHKRLHIQTKHGI